jgi:hypothetical protein
MLCDPEHVANEIVDHHDGLPRPQVSTAPAYSPLRPPVAMFYPLSMKSIPKIAIL